MRDTTWLKLCHAPECGWGVQCYWSTSESFHLSSRNIAEGCLAAPNREQDKAARQNEEGIRYPYLLTSLFKLCRKVSDENLKMSCCSFLHLRSVFKRDSESTKPRYGRSEQIQINYSEPLSTWDFVQFLSEYWIVDPLLILQSSLWLPASVVCKDLFGTLRYSWAANKCKVLFPLSFVQLCDVSFLKLVPSLPLSVSKYWKPLLYSQW